MATRRLWRLLPVALLLPGLYLVGREAVELGFAESLAQGVSREVQQWQQRRPPASLERVVAARSTLDRAGKLSPENPAIPELLAGVQLHGGGIAAYQLAEMEYIHATRMRPSSPYGWAGIAEMRDRQGFPAADVKGPLVIAWRLGSAEPDIQRIVIDVGLALWDSSPEVRPIVERALPEAMRRSPYRTLPILARRDRLQMACSLVVTDPRLERTVWPRRCKAQAAR